ncbi:Hypothetical predicted protein [Podarcis lilfordi]|uniref:Uncharacterized protein n=1 Tax=Podarcis lilfordi TaxID=74358 RepID=A0AA35JPW3_9SAUR|nr:Hypothetical predicted protein [Podarcis lilfordi]
MHVPDPKSKGRSAPPAPGAAGREPKSPIPKSPGIRLAFCLGAAAYPGTAQPQRSFTRHAEAPRTPSPRSKIVLPDGQNVRTHPCDVAGAPRAAHAPCGPAHLLLLLACRLSRARGSPLSPLPPPSRPVPFRACPAKLRLREFSVCDFV